MFPRLMFLFIVGVGTTVLAQGVGGSTQTHTSHVLEQQMSIPEFPSASWGALIGSFQNPVSVEFDPSGPAWLADFNTATGYPLAHDDVVFIEERLSIQGDLPWTGWQMEVLTNDFAWASLTGADPTFDVRMNGVTVPGLTVDLSGPIARATFDPLPVGTSLQIIGHIAYEGTSPFTGFFQVKQFPTPEPSSLLGFLTLFCLTRRRKSR